MEKFKVKFRYTPPVGGVKKVYLSGSFNDWSPLSAEMILKNGFYEKELLLNPGRYTYKFVVDGVWQADDRADFFEDDGKGGRNSVILVGNGSKSLYVVTVEYETNKTIDSLYIAGNFNNWNSKKDKFSLTQGEKYKIDLLLSAGEYEYKLVINDTIWITDPNNNLKKKDGNGGENSILMVDDNSQLFTGQESELFHFNLVDNHFPCGEQIAKKYVRFACRTYRNNIDQVLLQTDEDSIEMQRYYSDQNYDYYSLLLPTSRSAQKFQIRLIKNNQKHDLISQTESGGFFTLKTLTSDLEWLQTGVIYQIFCDRFFNGDSSLNPTFEEWYYDPQKNPLSDAVRQKHYHFEENWQNWQILKDHPHRHQVFYGGDLAGVLQKIPYLKELGISCIYFNPLVKAASNHKYDAFDFFQIDPHFGTNELFKKLVAECHRNEIRIILDFAFNHVGIGFFAFQDCLNVGRESEYFNWFDWYKFPLPAKISARFQASEYYQCWWGHAELPDLNFDLKRFHPQENYLHDEKDAEVNRPLVNYLLRVAKFWLQEMNIDGFRLDVPNEVPFWFWKLFRQTVKSIKPDAYLVGEIWHNAEEWLEKYFDSVMNYNYFREPVLQYFALRNWPVEKFLNKIMEGLNKYGFANLSLMMNLMDSHDTYRFLEAAAGDFRKLKLAVIFQMCWIGVPHVFYGDETGLQGAKDPDNRRPMNWDFHQSPQLSSWHDFYVKLINIRRQNLSLIYGDVKILSQDSAIFCFQRDLNDESILILINNSLQASEYDVPGFYLDLLDNVEVREKIQLKELEGRILKRV